MNSFLCTQSTNDDKEVAVALLFSSLSPKKCRKHFIFFFNQVFKVFLLFFAVFVAAASAAKVCKCEGKKVKKGDALSIQLSTLLYFNS